MRMMLKIPNLFVIINILISLTLHQLFFEVLDPVAILIEYPHHLRSLVIDQYPSELLLLGYVFSDLAIVILIFAHLDLEQFFTIPRVEV